MFAEEIKREAVRIKAKYQTSDPFEVCGAMKIRLLRYPMGRSADSCKGFFIVNARKRLIAVNSDLPEHIRRIICAHELGHAVLHTSAAMCTFHDFSVFEEAGRQEYEANVFASEFLLTDGEILEALETEPEFFSLASCLGVPPEMLDFKLQLMQKAGCRIKAPCIARSDFLKRDIGRPME